jgi:hypothetical protein
MSDERCGKWMPRKQVACARTPGHGGPCQTPEAMQRMRERNAARVLLYGRRRSNPAAKSRYQRTYKLTRYGLTQELYDLLLKAQDYTCAMCGSPFRDGQPVFIDHDHACCPQEKASCGKCVRGLLDLACNTALAYLDNPPGRLIVGVAA